MSPSTVDAKKSVELATVSCRETASDARGNDSHITQETSQQRTSEGGKASSCPPDAAAAAATPGTTPRGDICVSNEALRSSEGEAMCTLEVLVKHTRERVGETGGIISV